MKKVVVLQYKERLRRYIFALKSYQTNTHKKLKMQYRDAKIAKILTSKIKEMVEVPTPNGIFTTDECNDLNSEIRAIQDTNQKLCEHGETLFPELIFANDADDYLPANTVLVVDSSDEDEESDCDMDELCTQSPSISPMHTSTSLPPQSPHQKGVSLSPLDIIIVEPRRAHTHTTVLQNIQFIPNAPIEHWAAHINKDAENRTPTSPKRINSDIVDMSRIDLDERVRFINDKTLKLRRTIRKIYNNPKGEEKYEQQLNKLQRERCSIMNRLKRFDI